MKCAGNIFLYFGVIYALFVTASPVWAGPWALPKGNGQIISSSRYSQANNLLQDMGEMATPVEFSKFDSEIYWEHGLKPQLTLVASSIFQTVDYMASTGREVYTGFGDTQVGVRYQFHKTRNMVFAVQPSYIIAGNGENIADADLGGAGNALELRFLMGISGHLRGKGAFFDGQIAGRFRQDQDPSSYKVELTGGYDLTKRNQILVQGFYDRSNQRQFIEDVILPSESLKVQLSFRYKLKRGRSLQFGGYRTLAGQNIVRENGLLISLWQRY